MKKILCFTLSAIFLFFAMHITGSEASPACYNIQIADFFAVSNNDIYTVSAIIQNNEGIALTLSVITSVYSSADRLIATKQQTAYVDAGGKTPVSQAFINLSDSAYAKIFIWKSINSAQPLSEPEQDVIKSFSGETAITEHMYDGQIHTTEAEKQEWYSKQDKLTAGENITIENGVISATVNFQSNEGYNEFTARLFTEIKPAVTFVSDDGNKADYEVLKDVFSAAGVPCVLAIVTDRIGKGNSMTLEQIKELQDDYGYEIASHTHTHPELLQLTDEEVEYELRISKEILLENGLVCKSLMIPYGHYDNRIKAIAQKYYRGVRNSDDGEYYKGYNIVPIKNLQVASSGTEFEDLNSHKTKVDKAIEDKAWLVFLFHGWSTVDDTIQANGSTKLQNLTDLIAYIKSKNIDIITFDEGLDRFANPIDVGQNSEFRVGIDGTLKSRQINTLYLPHNTIDGTMPLSEFKRDTITITTIKAGEQGLPDVGGWSPAGMLLTYNFNSSERGYQFQEYVQYISNNIFRRKVKQDGTWDSWYGVVDDRVSKDIDIRPELPSDHLPSDLSRESLTVSAISAEQKMGYPENSPGTLIAYGFGGFGWDKKWYFEEYHILYSNKKYTRYSGADGSWQPWVNPQADNAYQIDMKVAKDTYDGMVAPHEFPKGKIIHTSVGNGKQGFPNPYSASLIINTVNSTTSGDCGYIYQEWRRYGENRIFTRAAVNGTAWADWVEVETK